MQPQGSKSAAVMTATQSYKPGRRPRVPLSCDACRSRKLKCNREEPCQNCITRNEQSMCKYKRSSIGNRSFASSHHQQEEREDTALMQQRIDHLEDLVKTMMAQSQENLHFEDHALPKNGLGSRDDSRPGIGCDKRSGTKVVSATSGSADITVTDRGQSVYRAAHDWSDVLKEVNELKKDWNRTQDDPTDYDMRHIFSNMINGSGLLSGQIKPVEMTELLAFLPPKGEVDKMIDQFFDREKFPIPIAPILHKPAFMHEYTEHWRNPSGTNPIWLGLLFSILGITMLSYHQFDNEPPEYQGSTEELCELYRLLTAQCLIIGDIAKCLPYTLETLLLNSTAELNRKDDSGRGLWMMTGVIVRVAINMGYHREPSQTSSISVLQREMRRRVWLAVETKDNLSSFLVGFPVMMTSIYSDTLEPRNLYDWELSDDATVIPPSRPMKETTPATYFINKGRLARELGRVNNINNDLRLESYDKVIDIDKSLHDIFESIIAHMKEFDNTPESSSPHNILATNVSIMQMSFLYNWGMCVLHRKFLAKARTDNKYSLSRERCISTSLAILAQQESFHQQSQSNVPSYVPNWYAIAQARHFFTLAAMILFLELEHRRKGTNADVTPGFDVLFKALERSCAIWEDVKSTSDEAWKVYHLLKSMFLSFRTASEDNFCQIQTSELASTSLEPALPLQISNDALLFEESPFEKTNEMDIDWATWDSYIEGASFEEAYQGTILNSTYFSSTTTL